MIPSKFSTLLESRGVIGLHGLQLEDFHDTGRGVKTLRTLKTGDVVVSIPGSLLWKVDEVFADPFIGNIISSINPPLSEEDTLAVFLLFVKSRKKGYVEKRAHIELLPISFTTSLFFTDEELKICDGSSLFQITKLLKKQIIDDYLQLYNKLFSKYPDLFPSDNFTEKDYKWAISTIWSRAMDFRLVDKQFRCIAPFADMFNHSSDAQLCHSYNPQSDTLQILAGKDYTIGDQVFINYGSISNSRLLRLYGFILPNNTNDIYDLELATHFNAPIYAQKVALFELAGLKVNTTFPLKLSDPLPLGILQYLRIQRLTESEIINEKAKLGAKIIVSARNESEILNVLIDSCENLLAEFEIPLEKLELNISSGLYQKSGNKLAAAHVSLGEQKIISKTLQKAKSLYKLVVCAQCKKADDNNRLCSRCKSVVYCGNECQRNNYHIHKVECKLNNIK